MDPKGKAEINKEDEFFELMHTGPDDNDDNDGDDPAVQITFQPDAVIHTILGLPGTALIPPQINVPQLAQGATPALSKRALLNWLDTIFDINCSKAKRFRNRRGLVVEGSYTEMTGPEYGKFESAISDVLPLVRDMLMYQAGPHAPRGISAGQMKVFWGGERGRSTFTILKIGLFMDD